MNPTSCEANFTIKYMRSSAFLLLTKGEGENTKVHIVSVWINTSLI